MTVRIDSIDHLVLTVADIERTGAVHPLLSVCFHDPDENLVEVANALEVER